MSNTMSYKGYTARVEFDPRDNIFAGLLLGVEDSITFHGKTVAGLTAGFQAASTITLPIARQPDASRTNPIPGN